MCGSFEKIAISSQKSSQAIKCPSVRLLAGFTKGFAKYSNTHAHTRACAHTHTHTYEHRQAQTNTHAAHTHTHTNTHRRPQMNPHVSEYIHTNHVQNKSVACIGTHLPYTDAQPPPTKQSTHIPTASRTDGQTGKTSGQHKHPADKPRTADAFKVNNKTPS